MTEEHHVETPVLLDGLHDARRRFIRTRVGTPAAFHAAFEVLAWAGAIRDRFEQEGRPIGSVLNGLWYVRNLTLHRGVDVLDWILIPGGTLGGTTFGGSPFGGGGGYQEWTWRFRQEMPEPRSKRGAKDYDAHIAGRSITEVFGDLAVEIFPAAGAAAGAHTGARRAEEV